MTLEERLEALERRVAELEGQRPAGTSALERLFERVEAAAGGAWTVHELAALGLVPREEVQALSIQLRKQVRRGGQVGRFELVKLDCYDREGVVYTLRPATAPPKR